MTPVIPDLPTLTQTLNEIAPLMVDYVDRAKRPADWRISDQFSLVLVRVGQMYHLTTTLWCRQPHRGERNALRAAFNLPDDVIEDFKYDNGWGLYTLKWTRPQPVAAPAADPQPALFAIENKASSTYYKEL